MKLIVLIVFLLIFSMVSGQYAIEGTWKTIDDTSGKPRSIDKIFEKNGKRHGRIERDLDENERNQLCIECKGNDYNKPIEGLEIIKNLEKDDNEYTNGTILDPENGKVYKCKIWIDDTNPNILNVRGYVAFFYRTQHWLRE